MSRNRRICPNDVLDAAERVVLKSGSSGLSIDAVAKEAGISKSQVVYDHKTKSGLLEALVDRQLQRDGDFVKESVASCSETQHPELFGRIKAAATGWEEAERAVCMAVSASLSSDDRLQELMRQWQQNDLNAIKAGPKPRAALVAYMALSGFSCMELFGFHKWSDEDREALLSDIRKIYEIFPDE